MKKFIYTIIALLGILMPNTAWAAEGTAEPYAVLSEDNTVLTFYYDDQKAANNGLSIGPFGRRDYPEWKESKSLTTVVFNASFAAFFPVSTAYWFYGCSNLTTINGLENLKTDNVTEMNYMFRLCKSLTSLDLRTFNTENVTDMGGMFDGCSGLTNIELSSFNTTNVTSMRDMFGRCSSLTNLDLHAFDTENVENMDNMFSNCTGLTSLDVTGFKTDKVTDMNAMFQVCSSLTSLDLNNFNTENVISMSNMFEGCHGLTSLDLSNFKTDNVESMKEMFKSCTGLTSLNLSNWNNTNVQNMGSMFEGCRSLTELNLTGFKTDNVTTMARMFEGCKGLTGLNLTGFNTGKVTSFLGMFSSCSSLTDLDFSNWNTTNVKNLGQMFDGCTALTSINLSSFNTDKVTEMGSLFRECSALSNLDLSNFNTDNVETMSYMFANCSALTDLDLSNFNTGNVTNMDMMFASCTNLKTLNLSGFKTDNVTTMELMFAYCSSLTSLDLSNWKNDNVTNATRMFEKCTSLTSLDVSNWENTKITEMGNLFQGCASLTNLNLTGFKTDNVTGMHYMFYGCSSLKNLDLSSFNTENVTGMSYMFSEDSSLTELDLSSFNTKNVTNMDGMFSGCTNLKTVYVSVDWSTAAVYSSDYMFAECSSIVGGAGTKYAGEDHSYAHIDGGPDNPGYFTDIADKGKEKMEQVETPYWNFEEDSLVLYNITEGATIYYEMKSWETQEQADSLANGMTVDTSSNVYSKAIAVEDNFVLKMFAAKEGMENSNDTTFIYNYKIWKQLQEVVKYGDDILYKAKESGKVDSLLLMELDEGIMDGYRMYHHRAFVSADQAQVVIENLSRVIKQVEEQLYATSEQVATPIFKFADNLLELFTETIDAKIYYAIQEFDNNLETDTIAKYARNLQVSVDSIEYKGQIEANFDFIIKAMAVSEGMEDSEEATLIYPFTEWQNMLQTIDIGNAVFSMILDAEHSDEVAKLIEDVQMRMAEVESVYNNSRTEWDRETVRNEREYLKSMIDVIHNMWQDEQSQKTTAKYENHILTVEGDVSMAQALEQVGGRNVVAKDIAAIVWNSSEAITRSDIEGFGNPNMLIYVQTDSLAPEGVNNVVIDGKAKSIILVDADSTNNNFYAPQAFVAESIQYTREFKQTTEKDVSRGWEGICLPFTVQKFTHESHGEIAPFGNDASIFHFWLHQMTDKGMANATTIEANKPYIISMPNNVSYPEAYNQAGKVTFSAENATVPVSDNTAIWSADGTIGMMSTYLRIEPSEHFYALNVGNAMEGYAEGSVFVQNLRDVKPFEVFTFHEPSRNEGAGARFISVSSLFGGEGTTGIIDIMKAIEPNGETWYDMNGRRLQSKPSRKGVYIMNGKKVVVK